MDYIPVHSKNQLSGPATALWIALTHKNSLDLREPYDPYTAEAELARAHPCPPVLIGIFNAYLMLIFNAA